MMSIGQSRGVNNNKNRHLATMFLLMENIQSRFFGRRVTDAFTHRVIFVYGIDIKIDTYPSFLFSVKNKLQKKKRIPNFGCWSPSRLPCDHPLTRTSHPSSPVWLDIAIYQSHSIPIGIPRLFFSILFVAFFHVRSLYTVFLFRLFPVYYFYFFIFFSYFFFSALPSFDFIIIIHAFFFIYFPSATKRGMKFSYWNRTNKNARKYVHFGLSLSLVVMVGGGEVCWIGKGRSCKKKRLNVSKDSTSVLVWHTLDPTYGKSQ